MMEEIRWSPYSRESCTVRIDEENIIGFGAHPVFDIVPGSWNIFWLTFAQLDQIAHYKGDMSAYLVTCDALAVCAGAAMQSVNKKSIGELAATMRPKEFVDLVVKIPTFLPFVFFGKRWFNVATARAAKYRVMPDNVIRIDFRNGG